MIDVVGAIEWLFAVALSFVTEGGFFGVPILIAIYLCLTGRLAHGSELRDEDEQGARRWL